MGSSTGTHSPASINSKRGDTSVWAPFANRSSKHTANMGCSWGRVRQRSVLPGNISQNCCIMHPGTGTKAVSRGALKNANVSFCPTQHLKTERAAVKLKWERNTGRYWLSDIYMSVFSKVGGWNVHVQSSSWLAGASCIELGGGLNLIQLNLRPKQ